MSKRYEQAKQYTEKYKEVLAPCKYCGSIDIIITSERNLGKNCWTVNCTTHACDCTAFCTSVKDAVKKWNAKHKRGEQYEVKRTS